MLIECGALVLEITSFLYVLLNVNQGMSKVVTDPE